MKSDIMKKVAGRYVALIVLLALFFVYIILNSDISSRLFVNIVVTLVLLAVIPFAIIYLTKKKSKK